MIVLGNFLIAVAQILGIIFTIFYWLILIRALVSWVSPDPYNPVVRFLYQTTEPVLVPIRRFLPPAGVDFSPIIAFLVIIFLKIFLVGSLYDIGARLKYERRYSDSMPRLEVQAPQEEPVSSEALFR